MPCLRGARAVHDLITKDFPLAEVSISLVWIDMLAGDNSDAALASAGLIHDRRIRHFHDPDHLAGSTIADSLGAAGNIAWDMYLFYGKGSDWREKPPKPLYWTHQLSDEWADQEHFAWGDELRKRLHDIFLEIAI